MYNAIIEKKYSLPNAQKPKTFSITIQTFGITIITNRLIFRQLLPRIRKNHPGFKGRYLISHQVVWQDYCCIPLDCTALKVLMHYFQIACWFHFLKELHRRYCYQTGYGLQKWNSTLQAYRNSWTLDARGGRWALDARLWTLDSGRWTLDPGLWTLDAGLWTLDSGRWTLDAGLWILYAELWMLDSGRFSDYTNKHIRTPRSRVWIWTYLFPSHLLVLQI